MGKRHRTLTIDEEICQIMVTQTHINWSDLVNNLLKTHIHMNKFVDLEEKIMTDKIKEREEERDKMNEEITVMKITLANSRKKKEDNLKEMLRKEKEAEEAKKRCINCKSLLRDNAQPVQGGSVCKTCFFNATKVQITQWIGKS